ncbi:MAG TPA: hypothetical protein VMS45_10040, partial [Gemmatimonadaceae bacterium]|nr:hypothetical protein [Gemmatimonadaceae bacterium]
APGRLFTAAGAIAGVTGRLSQAAGIDPPGWARLRALVRFALLLLIERALLLVLPVRHHVVHDFGSLCRALPVGVRLVALRPRPLDYVDLLSDGFSEARHECLEIAEPRSIHAGAGGPDKVGRITRLVALELGELGLALRHAALAGGQPLRLASLFGVGDALNHL